LKRQRYEADITLDLNTVYFFGILVQLGVLVARVCVQLFAKQYGGFKQWTLASATMVAAFITFALRSPDHPSLGIMISLPLMMIVVPLHLDGLIVFLTPDAKRLRRTILQMVTLAVVAFEVAYLSNASSTVLLGIVFGSIDCFNVIILYVALRDLRRGGLSTMWLIVACVSLSLLQHIARVAMLLFSPDAATTFSTDEAIAWSCIVATVQQMLTAIAQFTLAAQRVRVDLEAAQGELEELAWTDPLTGLRNRRRFIEEARTHIDGARRHDRPLALLMCDLDHFKCINDTYGHAVGDQVLEKVGRALNEMARLSDCVGRIGGEEFAVLLTETDRSAAQLVAERFRCRIEAIKPPDPGPAQITMSVGIATLHPEDATIEILMDRADRALYRAKAAGRNCCMSEEPSSKSYSDLRLSRSF
jgi:diguanylate cyclase (GGDEF)-like protein